jgi:hypothetical protein
MIIEDFWFRACPEPKGGNWHASWGVKRVRADLFFPLGREGIREGDAVFPGPEELGFLYTNEISVARFSGLIGGGFSCLN